MNKAVWKTCLALSIKVEHWPIHDPACDFQMYGPREVCSCVPGCMCKNVNSSVVVNSSKL